MVGGCYGATGAVAMPCELIAMVRGALVCVLSTIKAYLSFDFYFGLHFGGQFDPQDELLPPPDPYTNRRGIKFTSRRNSELLGESQFWRSYLIPPPASGIKGQ